MTDPTGAHRDAETSYHSYQQWLAARKRRRFATHRERPWKITVSRDANRTIYMKEDP